MPPNVDQQQLFVAARRVLLDAAYALAGQCEALILVGAQTIYMHSGDADIPVAVFTADADIGIDRNMLSDDPRLEDAMLSAGFELRGDGVRVQKDAGDVIRLMRTSDVASVSASFAGMIGHQDLRISSTARAGLDLLSEQFGRVRGRGIAMARRALAGALPDQTIEGLATAFIRGIQVSYSIPADPTVTTSP